MLRFCYDAGVSHQAAQPMGATRSRVTTSYALITPDTHVSSPLVGWTKSSAIVHIAPELGARFTQYTASMEPGGESGGPGVDVSRFVYVLEGSIVLKDKQARELIAGDFAFLPPAENQDFTAAEAGARLAVFEKTYALGAGGAPEQITGTAAHAPSQAFQGDPDLQLQTLLPTTPAFDMAVNVFTYQAGGRLPQVEVHVMEHGLLMLEGEGIYRLGDDWFPVQAGDVIWMASYCPQWFVAMGKQPAKYLYYKDVHRDRLTEKSHRV